MMITRTNKLKKGYIRAKLECGCTSYHKIGSVAMSCYIKDMIHQNECLRRARISGKEDGKE